MASDRERAYSRPIVAFSAESSGNGGALPPTGPAQPSGISPEPPAPAGGAGGMPPMAGSAPAGPGSMPPAAAQAPQEPPDAQVQRIEAGEIPLAAEQRLNALRSGGAFTSDLSAADFALCRQAGLRPLAQVMGTSVYQVGWDPTLNYTAGGFAGGGFQELPVLTRAYNEARLRALYRLGREAQAVGADAVVGATWRVSRESIGDAEGSLEYSIVGTAVRREQPAAGSAADGAQVLTDLSVADYVKLLQAGIEPVGLAGWHSVFFTEISMIGGALVQALGGRQFRNFELPELTQAMYAAREQVMERMSAQAQQMGASGIVGVNLEHRLARAANTQAQGGNRSNNELLLHFNAFGTAIKRTGAAAPAVPRMVIDLASS